MADPHVLAVSVDELERRFNLMSRANGFRRDYRPVRRATYDLPLEEDFEELPRVQMDLMDEPGEPETERNDRVFMSHRLIVQVHVAADKTANGPDTITPVLDVYADILQAAYRADGAVNLRYPGSDCCLITHKPDEGFIVPFGDVEYVGSTVRLIFEMEFTFVTGDMGTATVAGG